MVVSGCLRAEKFTEQDRLLSAAEMIAALYEFRTIAVAEDRGDIYDVNPGTRVQWTEVRSYTGLTGPEVRVEWQPVFEAALKRRGLLGVLKGKEKPSEWKARMGRPDAQLTDANREMLTEGTSLSAAATSAVIAQHDGDPEP